MKKLYLKGCISDKKNAFQMVAKKKGKAVPFEIIFSDNPKDVELLKEIIKEAITKL